MMPFSIGSKIPAWRSCLIDSRQFVMMKSARRTVSSSFSRRPSVSHPPLTRALLEPDDGHEMLPWLDPCALEHRHGGAGRAAHNVGVRNSLPRRIDAHEFGVDELRHAFAKGFSI